jgi:hypothetical protein
MNKLKLLSIIVSAGLLIPCMSFAWNEQDDNDKPTNLKEVQKKQQKSGVGETVQSAIDQTFALGVCSASEVLPVAGIAASIYAMRITLVEAVPAIGRVFVALFKGIVGMEKKGDDDASDAPNGWTDAGTGLLYGAGALGAATLMYVSEQFAVRFIPSFYHWLRRSKMTKEAVDKHAPAIARTALKTAIIAAL